MKPDSRDDLRHLLREWQETLPADPALAARVVRETAGAQSNRGPVEPAWLLASALLGVGLGAVFMAGWDIRMEKMRAGEMRQHYLAWIDPLPAPTNPQR